MRITAKLGLMAVAAVATCVTSTIVLATQISTESGKYDSILAGTVAHGAQARVMQVTFKKQVQEWKDTLLRGYNPTDLKKYHDQFLTDQAAVDDLADKLAATISDPAIAAEVRQFKQAHRALDAEYQKSYDAFVATGGTNFKASDAMVKGQDRPPTDLIDKIVSDLEKRQAADIASQSRLVASRERLVIGIAAALLLVMVAALVFIARSITRPLGALRSRMEQIITEGDLTVRLADTARDEIGDVARAGNRFITWIHELIGQMVSASSSLAGSVDGLSTVAAQFAASAEETSTQAGVVSTAAEEVTRNVQTVSTGAEEMGASIREIAGNADEAAHVTNEAVDAATAANATISQLGHASAEIGDVVKVITSIAEQTNLLALNATIEAARAGDAGKGFAVVATEVKDLAQETAKATEDISRRVEAIQQQAEAAVAAIGRISGVIQQVSDYSTSIASAVEQQTATAGEISRNISEAATGADEITRTITSVATSAASTSSAAATASTAAGTITDVVTDLQEAVSGFRI